MTMSWTSLLAAQLGCSEAGLRLVLGQLAGYPLFWLHHVLLKKRHACLQHCFFTLSGMAIAYWAIGFGTLVHGPMCIVTTYLITRVCQGSLASTVFLFAFQICYLLAGYWYMATETYDISWTMPQCVMCLRLIGLAIDIYDGKKAKGQFVDALTEQPSLLEMFSHSFFIGGYFVGPQFSMNKYKKYIERNITHNVPSSARFAVLRLAIGFTYLLLHLLGSTMIPENFVESEAFIHMGSWVAKSIYFSLWSKIVLAKYIALWLFAEGAVILSGLAYNGQDPDTGCILWNGGANVRLRIFEMSSRFQHLIDSFNINTNAWVLTYVYKRLKFLNNRIVSQVGALLFLAVWHGYHSGYYVTFLHEFLVINFEKQFFPMLDNSSRLGFLTRDDAHPAIRLLTWMCGKLYVFIMLPHSFLPFVLLKHKRYLPVMWDTKFGVMLVFGSWPLWKPLAAWILKPQPRKQD